jgi:hypothetical protein
MLYSIYYILYTIYYISYLWVSVVEVVEEYAPQASRLPSVGDLEVVVGPLLQ